MEISDMPDSNALDKIRTDYIVISLTGITRLYNNGYKAGHHDTVEGQYTDIFECDMQDYHRDAVIEILLERINNEIYNGNTHFADQG